MKAKGKKTKAGGSTTKLTKSTKGDVYGWWLRVLMVRIFLSALAVCFTSEIGYLRVAQIGAEVAQQDMAEAVDRPVAL